MLPQVQLVDNNQIHCFGNHTTLQIYCALNKVKLMTFPQKLLSPE